MFTFCFGERVEIAAACGKCGMGRILWALGWIGLGFLIVYIGSNFGLTVTTSPHVTFGILKVLMVFSQNNLASFSAQVSLGNGIDHYTNSGLLYVSL